MPIETPQLQVRKGRRAIFRGKVRGKPVSVTMTPHHHAALKRNMRRLDITRADLIGLLVELYADTVELPTEPPAPSAA